MDFQQKILAERARILSNINQSHHAGEIVEKGEEISVLEFKDRLEKGEKFLTQPDIFKFQSDVRNQINKAYTSSEKEEIKTECDKEISLLKAVNVTNEFGRSFQFFTQSVKEEK